MELESPGKTSKEELSPIGMLTSATNKEMSKNWHSSRQFQITWESPTVISVNTVSLVSNMGIPSQTPILWSFGKPSLVTLPMEPRSWSTTSLLEARPNGVSSQALFFHCLMVWMDRDPSTVRAELKDSFSFLMILATRSKLCPSKSNLNQATSRSFVVQRPPTISMLWEDKFIETSESHWLPSTQRSYWSSVG